ncbi:hypothetical protein VTJ83DRAFT_3133 [Remersonia thermophila]|uniref:Uncharacterized protein n=1 Tax=Remersonia thermophila TaxID=72144 RepID=A0ABR4DDB1_9PEZI
MFTSSPIRYPSYSDEEVIQRRREAAQFAAMLSDSSESFDSSSDASSDGDIPAAIPAKTMATKKHKRSMSVSGTVVADGVNDGIVSEHDADADSDDGSIEDEECRIPALCFDGPATPESSDNEASVRNQEVSPVSVMDNDVDQHHEEGIYAEANVMDNSKTRPTLDTNSGDLSSGDLKHVLKVLRVQDKTLGDLKMAFNRMRRKQRKARKSLSSIRRLVRIQGKTLRELGRRR